MAESATVVSIKPGKVRKRRGFKFPKGVLPVITEHQWRVYEALAVAKLLARHIREPESGDLSADEITIASNAADAVARLLEPVSGIYDAHDLVLQAERKGVAND